MRTFHLQRYIDDSGVSGLGTVAEGTVYSTGQVTLCWISGKVHSIVVFESIEQVEEIHGHGGHTQIVWEDSVIKWI